MTVFLVSPSRGHQQVLEHLIGGTHFTEEEAEATLHLLLNEENEARIAAFLVLLRAKGETYEEVCFVCHP